MKDNAGRPIRNLETFSEEVHDSLSYQVGPQDLDKHESEIWEEWDKIKRMIGPILICISEIKLVESKLTECIVQLAAERIKRHEAFSVADKTSISNDVNPKIAAAERRDAPNFFKRLFERKWVKVWIQFRRRNVYKIFFCRLIGRSDDVRPLFIDW